MHKTESARRCVITVFGQGIPAQRIDQAESFVAGEKLSAQLVDELAVRIRKEVRVDSAPGIPADYARQVAGSLGARAFKRAVAQCEALTAKASIIMQTRTIEFELNGKVCSRTVPVTQTLVESTS
jgi:hypothetical protein